MNTELVISVLEQIWSWVAVSLAIYYLGTVSKRVAKKLGWHKADGWYDATVRIHPLAVGILCGFIPLPTLNMIDALPTTAQLISARSAWFMFAGAMCGQVYEAGKFLIAWVKRRYGGDVAPANDTETEDEDDEDDEEKAA